MTRTPLLTCVPAIGAALVAAGCGDATAQGIGLDATGGAAGASAGPSCGTSLADRVRSVDLSLGAAVIESDEYHPAVVAATPNGGALLGWREASQNLVHITRLDASDSVTDELPAVAGAEVHAIVAHDRGGALLVVDEDPDIYSPKYCRSAETPENAGLCGKMDLVRFDDGGTILWRSTLTKKANVDSDGALFIWWYQHTARLAYAGGTYAAYSRVAGSVPRPNVPGEVDIHAGDALFFANESGEPVSGGWDWGCSHSWAVRLAYNGRWGAACHGDPYPAGLRLVVLTPDGENGQVVLHEGVAPEQRALGGLVPMGGAFWLSHIAPGESGQLEVHLARVSDDGQLVSDVVLGEASDLDSDYPFRAYLAEYRDDQLLAGWKSGGKLVVMALDRETGEPLEGPATIGAPIDAFEELVALSNGDVAWAHATGAGGLTFTRIRGC